MLLKLGMFKTLTWGTMLKSDVAGHHAAAVVVTVSATVFSYANMKNRNERGMRFLTI